MNSEKSKCVYIARPRILSSIFHFHLHSPAKDKRSVVSTLMDCVKYIPLTILHKDRARSDVLSTTSMLVAALKTSKSRSDQPNNPQLKPWESPKAYVSIPYVKGVSKRIRRILNRENSHKKYWVMFSNLKEKLKGILYKVKCRTCF